MVHQHFRLVEPFTVAENIVLGDHRDDGRPFLLHRRDDRATRSAELGERYGLAGRPATRKIWQLSVGEQQRVEILKALYREARILILDEPTAVLTPQEAEALFVTLRAMAAEGRTVIFISHKLHEVMAVADRVTVLRGGRTIATVPTPRRRRESLAALMVGRDVELRAAPQDEPRRSARSCLTLEGLTARRRPRRRCAARTSRWRCARGEIVGDRRRRGERPARAGGGDHRACGRSTAGTSRSTAAVCAAATRARRSGAASPTSPRTGSHTGVAPSLSIASNVVLKSYRAAGHPRGPFLRLRRIRDARAPS